MLGRASPRNPMVLMEARSRSDVSLLVAWRSKASGRSARLIPLAVIRDTDERDAPILNVDRDTAAACIETVFHEFFDDCGRTLDHFAGCDSADYFDGEHSNRGRTTCGGHRIIRLPTPYPSSNFGQLVFGQLGLIRRRKLFQDPFKILFRFDEISGLCRGQPNLKSAAGTFSFPGNSVETYSNDCIARA